MPTQNAGKLLRKKLHQWSGDTITSTSGLVSISRLPVRSKPSVTAARVGGVSVSHSRAIIGPWLAAKIPTSLAMARRLFPGVRQLVQPRDELRILHADNRVVEAQQIGVG